MLIDLSDGTYELENDVDNMEPIEPIIKQCQMEKGTRNNGFAKVEDYDEGCNNLFIGLCSSEIIVVNTLKRSV